DVLHFVMVPFHLLCSMLCFFFFHRKGRIAPGYDADLLAVAAGVDHDPAGLCDVKAVWRSGTQVPLQASAVGYNTPS
ncbi:hypothetical protein NLL52_27850, partial [Klebsiella pneumoniae]|nr:hypothetical protein [Klebsiella pneumoniae]